LKTDKNHTLQALIFHALKVGRTDFFVLLPPVMQFSIKNIAAAYLMMLMCIKIMAFPFLCFHYELNKDYIAANFCENKDKPELHCYGKCHLDKQLAKTGDLPTSNSSKESAKVLTVDFVENLQTINFDNNPVIVNKSYKSIQDPGSLQGYVESVFHPPLPMV